MRKQYDSKGAEIGVSNFVTILSTSETIELDLPEAEFETENGWKLLPRTTPQVCNIAEFCVLPDYFLTCLFSFCENTLITTGPAKNFLRLNF